MEVGPPSTTSNTAYPSTAFPNLPCIAASTTTAPPRLCPTRIIPGSSAQPILSFVSCTTVNKSSLKVSKLRSSTPPASPPSGSRVPGLRRWYTVSPWPRASRDRIPASGTAFLISEAQTAKERPEEPAPWWVTKSGPFGAGGVM